MRFNIFRTGEFFFHKTVQLASWAHIENVYLAGSVLQLGVTYFHNDRVKRHKDPLHLSKLIFAWNLFGTLYCSGKLTKSLQKKYNIQLYSDFLRQKNWAVPDWTRGKIFSYNTAFIVLGAASFLPLHIFTSLFRDFQQQQRSKSPLEINFLSLAENMQCIQCVQNIVLAVLTSSLIPSIGAATALAFSFDLCAKTEDTSSHHPLTDYMPHLILAYGAIQFGLSKAQKIYPEYSELIYGIQKGMAAIDFLLVLKMGFPFLDHQSIDVQKYLVIFGALSLATFCYLCYEHYYQPHEVLTDHFKEWIPENELRKIQAGYCNPFSLVMIQWTLISKILLALFLAPVDKENQYLHFIQAVIITLILLETFELKFFSFSREFESPLIGKETRLFSLYGTEQSEVLNQGFQNTISKTRLKLTFIFDENTPPLEQTMKAIYDFSEKIFDDSHWKHWKTSHYSQHGIYLGETYHICAQILPRKILIEGVNYYKKLIEWGSITNKLAGSTDLVMEEKLSTQFYSGIMSQ